MKAQEQGVARLTIDAETLYRNAERSSAALER